MTISAASQAAIERLNAIERQIKSGREWTLGHGGWAYCTPPDGPKVFELGVKVPIRASKLPGILAKRERQLANIEIG